MGVHNGHMPSATFPGVSAGTGGSGDGGAEWTLALPGSSLGLPRRPVEGTVPSQRQVLAFILVMLG